MFILEYSLTYASHSMTSVCVSCPSVSTRSRMPARRRAPARRRVTRRRAPLRRRARASTARRRAPARRRQMSRMLTKYELGQVNPFDQQVSGVKIPDSNTQPSDTARCEDRLTISSDATINANCYAFMPNVAKYAASGTGVTSATWGWPGSFAGTASSNSTNYVSSFQAVRTAAHGIRISSQAAPTTITGFVHVALYPIGTWSNTTWAYPTSLSQMSQLPWYRRFTVASLTQRSVTVVNKFIDGTASRYFDPSSDLADTGTDISFQFAGGWCAVLVAHEGCPVSTSILSVENLVHYETLQKIGASGSQSPAAQYNVSELEDVSRIASQGNAIFLEGEESSQIRQAMSILGRGVSAAAEYVLPGGTFSSYGGGGIQGVNTGRLMQY